MRWLSVLLAGIGALAQAQVPRGTPIHLMLLKDVASSSSMIGDVVPLVVTQDVVSRGEVVIPEGTMAFAKISNSRREGALSAPVFDKPARLCISFEHLRDEAGNEVKLIARPSKNGEMQITREMTVRTTPSENKEIASAWDNTNTHSVMEKVHHLFSDTTVSLTEGEAEVLISHNVAMPAVQEAIRSGVFGQVVGFLSNIKHSRTLDLLVSISPTTRPALVAIRAVRELGRLSGGIGNYIEGRFKGRNIRCGAGAEFTVYSG